MPNESEAHRKARELEAEVRKALATPTIVFELDPVLEVVTIIGPTGVHTRPIIHWEDDEQEPDVE